MISISGARIWNVRHLVVARAGRTVGHGVGADLFGVFDDGDGLENALRTYRNGVGPVAQDVAEDHVADAFLVVLLLDVERRVCRGAQLHGALLDLFEFGFREPARVGDCRVNVVTLLLGEVFYTKRGVQTAAERQNHFLLGFHDILFFCFFIHAAGVQILRSLSPPSASFAILTFP